MMFLLKGDRGPQVVALQIILNRRGASLKIDGHFGRNTRQAVVDFQKRCSLKDDGIVGPKTWARLIQGMRYSVISAVDITKPGDELYDSVDIRKAGGNPIEVRSLGGGVAHVAGEITRRAQAEGPIILLRFHGHGGPGRTIVSARTRRLPDSLCAGTGTPPGKCPVSARDGSTIERDNLEYVISSLGGAVFQFAPFGSIELHGCRTGKGAIGYDLLSRLAEGLQVPVSAGEAYQFGGGGPRTTFRIEGPVKTVYPGKGTLESWAQKQRKIEQEHGMSVPV